MGGVVVSRVSRSFLLFGTFMAYVVVAFVINVVLETRPVLATCVFDAAVVFVFRPRGRFARTFDAGLPRGDFPRSRLFGMVVLWVVFWFGTQVTVTVLASAGVSTGVYPSLPGEEYFFYVVLTVFLAPVAEEFFFRAFLFGHLRRLVPFWVACLAQGVVFAWAHGSGVHWYVGVVCGLAFAFLYVWTGDVRVSACFHAFYNLLCVLGAMVPVPSVVLEPGFVVGFNVLVVLLMVLAGFRLGVRLLPGERVS